MITLKLPFGLIKNKETKKLYLYLFLLWWTFFYVDPNFWPISSSFLPKELLLAILIEQIDWWWVLSVFVCLRKCLFIQYFWRIILMDIEFYFGGQSLLSSLNISLHILLACMISDQKTTVILILVPPKVTLFIPLASSKSFSVSDQLQFEHNMHRYMCMCVCVCVSVWGMFVYTNPEQRDLEILVKYLSFLVFPEDIIQGKKGTFSLSWNFCTLNASYASGLWSAQFTLLRTLNNCSPKTCQWPRGQKNKEKMVFKMNQNIFYLSSI